MSRARLVSRAARGQQTEGWSRARRRAAAGHVVRAAGDLPACHLQRSGNCGGECPPRSLSLCVPAVCGALSTSVLASAAAAVLGVRPLSSPPLCAAAAADSSYSATLQRYFKALIREVSTEN